MKLIIAILYAKYLRFLHKHMLSKLLFNDCHHLKLHKL